MNLVTSHTALTSLRLKVIHALNTAAGVACRLSATGRDSLHLALQCTDRLEHLAYEAAEQADPLILLTWMREDLRWLRHRLDCARASLHAADLPFRVITDEKLAQLLDQVEGCLDLYREPKATSE
jgi:hypothetical protein